MTAGCPEITPIPPCSRGELEKSGREEGGGGGAEEEEEEGGGARS